MEDNNLIDERKKKLFIFLKKEYVYLAIILVLLVILGVHIRSTPFEINSNTGKPGLWDFAKNEWTLGPDLDPWLFERYAKEIVETGHLSHLDTMRNIPLGFDTTTELQMVSYMIVWTYKLVSPFYKTNFEYYAALMPVLFFALTIISFFLFVRELFTRKDEKNLKANIIASLSTFFMILIPVFISRTIAGIPEKESVGFFFMFLSLYLFLKAWKSEKINCAIIFGILSGLSTALMGLSWGGVIYLYTAVAASSFIAFLFGKTEKKEAFIYATWLITSLIVTLIFSNRFSLKEFATSLDTGLAMIVLIIFIVDFILWRTRFSEKINKIGFLSNNKIPKQFWSIIIAIILMLIIMAGVFGPSVITEKIRAFNQMMFRPVVGRWNTTVAENRQPYFWEWASSFGPFAGKFPVLFWLFLIGAVVLFRKMLDSLHKKDAWILTFLFAFFLSGIVFSRYSPASAFNGENFLSKSFYYLSALILVISLIYYYIEYKKQDNDAFSKISFESIFALVLLILCLFTARSAVRLIMTLGPIAPIFASYLCIGLGFKFFKAKEETSKVTFGLCGLIVGLLILYCLFGMPIGNHPGFWQQAEGTAKSSIPSYYTIQWQNAMNWVDKNTSKNAVFAHWWDYGYWLQSIGNRATVTDGGNAITYWNYLSGRYVLTGDNQKDALDFLYSHNATHLLIDSSDLGKYGAFSQIGSDINFDRLSSGPSTFISNNRLIQEKQNSTIKTYQIPRDSNSIGVASLEEDIVYKNNGTEEYFLKENSGIIGVIVESKNLSDNHISLSQPKISLIKLDSQKRMEVPARYLYFNGEFFDFGSGIEATIYLIQYIGSNSFDSSGVAMYISPRLMRGMLAQVYILNDPLKKFQNFELVHTERDQITKNILARNSGLDFEDFVYVEGYGLQGPIKIWEINYSGNEKVRKEFLDTDASEYLSWAL